MRGPRDPMGRRPSGTRPEGDPGTHESKRGRYGITCNRIRDDIWEMCSVKRGGRVKSLRVGPYVVTSLPERPSATAA